MAYDKTTWRNNSAPYIDDDHLNKIEQGIYDASLMGEYSEDETIVGTWTDGKPIYRKVVELPFDIDLTNDHWVEVDISADNVDSLLNVRGIVNTTSQIGTSFQPVPRIVTDANSNYGIGIGDLGKTKIRIQFGSKYTKVNYGEIIYEYIKSSQNT